MGSAHNRMRPGGLPRWILAAATPVVLALGFVAGLAIATYAPTTTDAEKPKPSVNTPIVQNNDQVQPTAQAPADPSWRIVTAGGAGKGAPRLTTPANDWSQPAKTAPARFSGPVVTREHARNALAAEFHTFSHAGIIVHVEYQAMRQAAASGVSLVGIISTADYPAWERALREQPDALRAWLQRAAERISDASAKEGFYLSWAVVEVVDRRPTGYADKEMIAMENDTYLVVRRLAAISDYAKSEISLRSAESLQESAANRQVTSNDPWATYGPVVRFDGEDIYRPTRLSGVNPKK